MGTQKADKFSLRYSWRLRLALEIAGLDEKAQQSGGGGESDVVGDSDNLDFLHVVPPAWATALYQWTSGTGWPFGPQELFNPGIVLCRLRDA